MDPIGLIKYLNYLKFRSILFSLIIDLKSYFK
jgi:hypothetical protein